MKVFITPTESHKKHNKKFINSKTPNFKVLFEDCSFGFIVAGLFTIYLGTLIGLNIY